MKKLLSILLALIMVFSMVACGGQDSTDTPDTPQTPVDTPETPNEGEQEIELKPYKIAVAFTQIDAVALSQQKYLEEYVGPAFNVEFVFSEAVESAEAAMTFLENAYASGCQAVMNFQNSSVEQINAKANELGMYIVSNAPPAENIDLPYVLGNVRAPVSGCAAAYTDMVNQFTADGVPHNVVIISAGAGLGNTQHYECTYAMLEALQKNYNLTYSDTIENLASSRGLTEVETGTDMKLLLYPGYPNSDTYVSGLSAELQSGVYDVVLGCNQATTKFAVAIDEVERAYGMDVKVGYWSAIDEAATAAVTTKDVNGNSSVNSIIINPGNILVGTMFSVLYNGVSGHADVVRPNGAGTELSTPLWLAPDADTYLKLTELNTSADSMEMCAEDIQELLYIYNPDVTAESMQTKLLSLTADGILTARGMK